MTGYETQEHHPAFEEYCETIFELKEDGLRVIQARLAERMNISRPAVSEMVRRLTNEGFITNSNGELGLTDDGLRIANRTVRRHRLAERFLTDVLKLSWSEAHHEAGKWEHIISDSVEQAMTEILNSPTTCPHGNPIPGTDYIEPKAVPLSSLRAGTDATITRIPEELEFVPGMLEYLENNNLLPGTPVAITSFANDGAATLEVGDASVTVSAHATARLLVTA